VTLSLDAAAIERAYRDYGGSVERRAKRLLGDEQDAREVVQEIFTSLLDRPQQFEGRSKLLTWLYSATTHSCLNRIRNRKTRLRLLEAHGEVAEAKAIDLEGMTAAREILSRLPEDLAQAAVYYYFDQMTHAEIAEVMSCSRRHVGDLLERFRQQMQRERSETDDRLSV
jgi:RNA polymerase sigma factor (sigma-70 family)